MKKDDILKIFLEQTVSGDLPSGIVPNQDNLPSCVVDAWNGYLDYSYKMKRKFGYFPVTMRDKSFTTGHKGTLTKQENKLKTAISDNKLDLDATILKLFKMYPPNYIG